MESSLQELVQVFRNEKGFNTLFSLFREKYRSYGRISKGTKVIITNPSVHELQTLAGFFGEAYKGNNAIMVTAAKFERAIMKSKYKELFQGHDVNDLLQLYFGGYLTSKGEDRCNFDRKKEQFFQLFLSQSKSGSFFYNFISFITHYKNAPFIHLMYKKDSDVLRQLLLLINKLFDQLPLNSDVFLPMLSYKLTDNFHALAPKSDSGRMILFALQVLNHLDNGADIISKPDEDQITDILQGYHIRFCPDSNKLAHRLWISESTNNGDYRYQLIPLIKIGTGGFAEVYMVFDPIAKKEMACKVLYEKAVFLQWYGKEGEDYLQRFKREVKLLREKISHQNIIEIDKMQLEHDPAFFTMPLAETSLEKWLELNPSLSEETKLSIFKDILNGVFYLHDYKISHRDLAPHNILLFPQSDETRLAKVADFGLAKDHRSLSSITRHSNMSYGRGAFTAPEQRKSLKNADFLSDVYSLGALLFYIYSGKSPEQRFTSFIRYQHIVGKAMEEERSKRYQSVQELMDDIDQTIYNSAQNSYSFNSLLTYEFRNVCGDVDHVLKCLPTVNVESPSQVCGKFVRPFIAIPTEVLTECAKNETVMIPFLHIAKENISRAKDCSEAEWNHVSLRFNGIYEGTEKLGLKMYSLNLILITALEKKNLLAQTILVSILGSLESQGRLSQQIAHMIEKEFPVYHELLISLLQETNYPLDIRDALNDY
ncbi:serine/threonine protein kinase [Desulfitobacterium hafniense DCB-2]|uniref:Serine/threonine protein kinase n=1 Tax=Desulfitobacterium hafniense (strain DSM 10664 / DCB-2) TaxID=272564 RepID=B8FRF8_DESHD|nr:protein kinase [Desulfitobacterium hafniense]ACL20073.1 serine/threonine protein kinase [Desulfitobacterium hafniense DCB-2]